MRNLDNPGRDISKARTNLLYIGLTLMLMGYLMVWLPGPSAGLRIIGIELGEWIKFLGVGAGRNWFYLPPIVVGLVLAMLTFNWSNRHPGTWVARGMAIAVAMLSFPAIAAIQLEPRSEWLGRVMAIGLVVVVAAVAALFAGRRPANGWVWLIIAGVSIVGLIAPTFQYLAVRPVVEAALHQQVGIGMGVWLNVAGALIVALVALVEFISTTQTKRTAATQAAALENQFAEKQRG